MNRNRARLLRLLSWSLFVLVALRPPDALRSLAGLVAAPLSLVAQLASPLGLVRAARVEAAERSLAASAPLELQENAQLLADLAKGARPSESELLIGRRLVHGEVLGPSAKSRDLLRVRLADLRGVVRGLPVASGNAYVGRVVQVPSGVAESSRATVPGVVLIELVTSRGFHVGARVAREDGEEVLMTVGGLDQSEARGRRSARNSVLRLAVHHPSDRSIDAGQVRVHELFTDAEPFAALAEGLHLGRVRRQNDGAEQARVSIEPELDFEDGLFHLVVLAPLDHVLPEETARDPSPLDSHWLSVTPYSPADPSPWRESAKILAGELDGVRVGAAVTAIGARLVGRVAGVGRWSSDVAFLGDPGFTVVAVARFEGEDEPRVLGRLVSLGRSDDGRTVRLRWKARLALDLSPTAPDGTRRARLFTGSGDAGLESGFFLGEARIPVGEAVALDSAPILLLETDLDPIDTSSLFVRLDPDSELGLE